MITCSKDYPDFPFAHRQPVHDGHCAYIHGHNWSFHFTFAAEEKDECGFVLDFGKLKKLKAWLDYMFDHTCVINHDDPHREFLESLDQGTDKPLLDLRTIPDCSCEGIAEFVFQKAGRLVTDISGGRAHIVSVTVKEDSKNSATYTR